MNLFEKAKNWKPSGFIFAEGLRRADFKKNKNAKVELQKVLEEIFIERLERNKKLKSLYLKAQRKRKDARAARKRNRGK